jgi:hypothetical protein
MPPIPPIPPILSHWLAPFAACFTKPAWKRVLVPGDRRRSGSRPAHRDHRVVAARAAGRDGFRPPQ